MDVPSMLDALRASDNSFRGELAYVVKILQACSLTPGIMQNIEFFNKDCVLKNKQIICFLFGIIMIWW